MNKNIYCPDCGHQLKKGRVEMNPGEWLVIWVCECNSEKREKPFYKSTGSGPRKVETVNA